MKVFIRVPMIENASDVIIAVDSIICVIPLGAGEHQGASIKVDQQGYINTTFSLDRIEAIIKNAKECKP